MKKQPDFTKLFYDYFGQTPRKVQYEVRQGPSRYHDLIFLSSLVHDARFQRENIRLRGHRLTVPINRDCWELKSIEYETATAKYAEMHIADATINISPVEEIQWTFEHAFNFAPDRELWIHNLWLERSNFDADKVLVTIDGVDWKCLLIVGDDDLHIKLRDNEIPYLYSERHKAEPGDSI
jgi:hypothetical protein